MSQSCSQTRLRHVAVVMNAKAGALLAADADGAASLTEIFATYGMQARFIGPEAGALPDRIAAALAENPDALIVAGGDGTVACAAQIMHGKTQIPLGILPFGTANLLARDLSLPIGDTTAAIAALAQAKIQTIDAGEVNGHIFLCAAMLGMPTHLGRHREEARGAKLKFLRRLPTATLRHILRPNPLRALLTIAGEKIPIRAAAATITVNPMAEATGLRFARANLNGGTLVFYEIRARGLAGWARFVARIIARSWRGDPALREWSARQLRLENLGHTATHVMVDGEMRLLTPPLDFTCHHAALRVLTG